MAVKLKYTAACSFLQVPGTLDEDRQAPPSRSSHFSCLVLEPWILDVLEKVSENVFAQMLAHAATSLDLAARLTHVFIYYVNCFLQVYVMRKFVQLFAKDGMLSWMSECRRIWQR